MTATETHNQLKSLIQKIEALEEEKAEIGRMIRDAFTEAKLTGFDPKIMKRVLKCRKMKRDQYLEEEHLLGTYLSAVGMNSLVSPEKPMPTYEKKDETAAVESTDSVAEGTDGQDAA